MRANFPVTMEKLAAEYSQYSYRTVKRFAPPADHEQVIGGRLCKRWREMPAITIPHVIGGELPAGIKITLWGKQLEPYYATGTKEQCEEIARRYVKRAFDAPNHRGWAADLLSKIQAEVCA